MLEVLHEDTALKLACFVPFGWWNFLITPSKVAVDIKPMFQSVLPFETAITAKEQTATQRREIKKMLLRTMGQEMNLSIHQCKIKKNPIVNKKSICKTPWWQQILCNIRCVVKISPHITKVKEFKGYNGKAPRIRTSLEFERRDNNTKNKTRNAHRV